MKKQKQTLYRSFGPVKLFLNDVREIIEALQEISDAAQIKIVAADYELSSFEELSQLKQKEISTLEISCKLKDTFSYFSTKVEKKDVLLRSDDTLILRGVFAKVENLLSSRQRKFQWIEPVFFAVMSAGTLSSIMLLQGQITKNAYFTYIGYSIAGLMAISLITYLTTLSIRKSEVLLYEQRDRPSFWKRNSDTIIVAIITSIISVIITLVVQVLTK